MYIQIHIRNPHLLEAVGARAEDDRGAEGRVEVLRGGGEGTLD